LSEDLEMASNEKFKDLSVSDKLGKIERGVSLGGVVGVIFTLKLSCKRSVKEV